MAGSTARTFGVCTGHHIKTSCNGLDSIDAISLKRTDTFISLRHQNIYDGRR